MATAKNNPMRWWLNTDDPQIFAVDNASVSGMDFSTLPINSWMVQWTDGKGEIENQIDPNTNDNGLRASFIDVTPYASFFQQFLTLLPGLTLAQAQKVQTDLIKQIFESKRQDPFHYPVASGDYSWDASDEALFSSHGAQLQNNLTEIGASVVSYTASATITIPAEQAWVRMWGGSGASGAGSSVSYLIGSPGVGAPGYLEKFLTGLTPGHTLTYTRGNGGAATTGVGGNGTPSILASGTQTIPTLTANGSNGTSLNSAGMYPTQGSAGGTATGGDINRKGQMGGPSVTQQADSTGVLALLFGTAGQTGLASGVDGSYTSPGNPGNPGGMIVSWGNVVVTTGMQWIPIGASAPVAVTSTEQTAILNGIAVRTNTLAGTKNTKVAQVEALTVIADVINYDVTAGW
jgi:hypothetical protein